MPTMLRNARSVLAKPPLSLRIAVAGCIGAALGVAGTWADSAARRLKGEEVPQRDKIKKRVVSC